MVNSVVYLMDPYNDYANRAAAQLNPAVVLTGEKPLLVDEWQEVPGIWDAVRFACDRTKDKGLFILTGSSTPRSQGFAHSGAGRICRINMRPMSLYESGDSSGAVSLIGLFSSERVEPGVSRLTQQKLIHLAVRGGWPENIHVEDEKARILPEQYNLALAETDMTNIDNVRRNPILVLHLLSSVARTNATPALDSTIVADIQARFGEISRQTISEYLSALKRLHVIEEIPQWFPELRSKLRLRKTPKRMLADPSIAVSALNARAADLERDPWTLGGFLKTSVLGTCWCIVKHQESS